MKTLGEELFNEKLYESTKRINVIPFHSYFIPFKKEEEFVFDLDIINREKSGLFTLLSGE